MITHTERPQTPVQSRCPKCPSPNLERIDSITQDGPKLVDLWDASPVQRVSDAPNTEVILSLLYPDDPWLCIGKTLKYTPTRTLHYWRKEQLDKYQYIVPSPMTGPKGRNLSGELKTRTNSNTGPRRYLVLDFDQGTLDQHAAIIWYLQKYAQLCLVMFSGGKGLHAWFNVHRYPEADVEWFFQYAVSVWADKRMWTPCQLARLPDGLRQDSKGQARQPVIYLNPENIPQR